MLPWQGRPLQTYGISIEWPLHYDESSPCNLDIIAIHDFNDASFKSWTKDDKPWVPVLANEFPNARIMTFFYTSTSISNLSSEVLDLGFELFTLLDEKRITSQERCRPCLFMPHGIGGVVLKKAIAFAHSQKIGDRVMGSNSSIAFFATPHKLQPENVAKKVVDAMVQARKLTTDPATYQRDSKEFINAIANIQDEFITLADNYNIINVHGESSSPGCKIIPVDCATMQHKSQKLSVALKASDLDICRLTGSENSEYRELWNYTRQALKANVPTMHDPIPTPTGSSDAGTSLGLPPSRSLSRSKRQAHVIATQLPPFIDSAFRGREELLRRMEHHFNDRDHSIPSFGLHGQGGVGKTQTARRYMHEHLTDFDKVFWVYSDTKEKILSECENALQQLTDSNVHGSPQIVQTQFRDWLQSNSGWLLIFDNADDLSIVKPYWPAQIGSCGCIIVTSRNPEVGHSPLTASSEVESFSTEDSAKMLLSQLFNTTQEMQGVAEKIVQRVGGLPLVINHMASFIRENSISLEAALDIYNGHDLKVVTEFEASGANFAYEKTMSTAWSVSISTLQPAAVELLEVFALMDPDYIPMALVSHFSNSKSKNACTSMTDLPTQMKAMASLLKKSLVKKEHDVARGGNVWIHRVVQDAVKCSWSSESRQRAFERTCFCICQCFPKQFRGQSMIEQYQDCAKFQSHLLVLEDFFSQNKRELEATMDFAEILANGGWYFFERGQTDKAYELLKTAESIGLGLTKGEPNLTMGLIYNNLGAVWATRGDRKTGAEATGKAIEHREKSLSRDDPDIQELATSYSNYANHLRMLNRIDEAKKYYFLGLDIRRECPGSTPELEELTLSNIAGFFSEQPEKESMDLALKYIKEAMDFHPKCKILSSYMLVTEYAHGKILASLGRIQEAYQVHKSCLQKRQVMEGNGHYITGTSSHRTGCLAYQLSRLPDASPEDVTRLESEAISMLRDARETFRKSSREPGLLPRTLIKLSWVLLEVGTRYKDQQLLDEAEEALVEAKGFKLFESKDVEFPIDDPTLDLLVRPTFR